MTNEIKPIYSGRPENFHWAGFGSGSGTNLRECAKVITPALIFTDRPAAQLLNLDELANVPTIVMNGYELCGSWKKAQGNPEAETEYRKRSIEYNKQIVDSLKRFEDKNGFGIDLIVLGGYMRLVEEPLLKAYPDKIINVHPADLGILDGQNRRVFIGEDAVYDAIIAGQKSTCSSIIMVDGGVDHGEILMQGPEVGINDLSRENPLERIDMIRAFTNAHQQRQKTISDWPALTSTLKMISEGRIALGTEKEHFNEWRAVYVDDKKMPYCGMRMN